MSLITTTMWFDEYKKLSSELYSFYKRKEHNSNSVGQELYNLLINDSRFLEENKWFEKFTNSNLIKSVDPMHLFASISPNNLSDKKREYRIKLLLEILKGEPYSSDKEKKGEFFILSFDGCPAPPQIHSLAIRNEDSQKEIWRSFIDIYVKGQDCDLNDIFLKSKKWYGFSTRLLTIYLFWIRPDSFLPLDRNTVAILKENNIIERDPRNSAEYIPLLIKKRETNFYKNLALVSYDIEFYDNLADSERYEIDQYLKKEKYNSFEGVKHQFRLLAIKPLEGCNANLIKSLKVDELYKLSNGFELTNKGGVYRKSEYSLFDVDDIKVNVNAIVGKNGTGKSTIVELFMAASNNLYCKGTTRNKHQLCWIDNLNIELYFETDSIYKVTFLDEKIKIIKYKEIKEFIFEEQENLDVGLFNFNSYFYSILINYSLHGLNSSLDNEWLEPLFHKNDGYQTPVVIEPFRDKGNININLQDDLAKQRLLSNLLIAEDKDDIEQSHRILKRGNNHTYKAESFILELDKKKSQRGLGTNMREFKDSFEKLSVALLKKFECPVPNNFFKAQRSININHFVLSYLKLKLVSIAKKYSQYQKFYNAKKNKFICIIEFVNALRLDTSHRVVKLRRAINYLKFDLYKDYSGSTFSIDKISIEIEGILGGANKSGVVLDEEKLDYLLPPSFFSASIFLENEVEFSKLSSGEKQIIFSISSLIYHLRNVDTTQIEDGYFKYESFNIFLDEIELCLHPELQRIYFTELRNKLTQFAAKEDTHITGLNICFVTHSPFVLSDIPSQNVLFLDHDEVNELQTVPYREEIKTFAANIHDLLNNGFFVNGTIGNFAELCIKEVVAFNGKVRSDIGTTKEKHEKLKEEYKDLKYKFSYILSIIGDEHIKNILANHIFEIEDMLNLPSKPKLNEDEQKRILELQSEIKRIENRIGDE